MKKITILPLAEDPFLAVSGPTTLRGMETAPTTLIESPSEQMTSHCSLLSNSLSR